MTDQLSQKFIAAVENRKVPGVGAVILDRSGEAIFKGCFGTINIDDPLATPYTSSTSLMLLSCTKIVTSVAALQLLEQGKIHLEDAVEDILPEYANIQVLDGFNSAGEPKLRVPKVKATILHLMTHTCGFTYDFFDKDTLRWRLQVKQTSGSYGQVSSMQVYMSPLNSDPGTEFRYGVNTDWLGFVIEAVTKTTLPDYIEQNILRPLGMIRSGSTLEETSLAVHFRNAERILVASTEPILAKNPEKFGGGHYLCSTLDDYSNFLLTVLNYGTHPHSGTQILKRTTVEEYLFKDHLRDICSDAGVGVFHSSIPLLVGSGEFLPGIKKGWSCGQMLNLEACPMGRSVGSGCWAGLGNVFYWLDPKAGKLGLLTSTVFPYLDEELMTLFDMLEKEAYGHSLDVVSENAGPQSKNFQIFTDI